MAAAANSFALNPTTSKPTGGPSAGEQSSMCGVD
jgi:hypothetical protein